MTVEILAAVRAVFGEDGIDRLIARREDQTVVKYGVGFGSALAMSVSFALNKSIFWAIIHGILGWIYVVYAWLFKAY